MEMHELQKSSKGHLHPAESQLGTGSRLELKPQTMCTNTSGGCTSYTGSCSYQATSASMQSQLQTQPLASLIAYTAGQPVSVVAGAAIALANRSDLNELKDVEHQRVRICIAPCQSLCHVHHTFTADDVLMLHCSLSQRFDTTIRPPV